MPEKQGYFSLIQYSEYPERAEFVNIGIVLFARLSPFVFLKLVEKPNRITKVFGRDPGVHFRDLRQSIERRLIMEFSKGWRQEAVDAFVDLRSGKVRLSQGRSILVEGDPRDVLAKLFEELVGEIPRRPSRRVDHKLAEQFHLRGVEQLLEKPKAIFLPSGVKVKAPYGYQNGSYNLIKAVSLEGEPDAALERASPHMIEGRLLHDATVAAERKRLVIVGDTADQENDFVNMIADLMEDHEVGFYRLDKLDPLIDDIRKNVTVQ